MDNWGVNQVVSGMNWEVNVGLINVRSWKEGKVNDIVKEMSSVDLHNLAVTQTTLRDEVSQNLDGYRFLGKGRVNMNRMGGGVGVIVNEGKGV